MVEQVSQLATGLVRRPFMLAMAMMMTVLLATVAVYFPGLSGPLLLDDIPQLNSLIAHGADAPETLIHSFLISSSGPFGRPVAMTTFILDAMTHGDDIWWWKYNNVMLHLIAGLLVFWLTSLLLQATRGADTQPRWLIAAVAAALWMLHPLHVSTVLYTVQRMAELSTLLVFAGLVCYVAGRQRLMDAVGGGWLLISIGFGLFFPLAVLSKETALLFPVYCGLIEVFVFQFSAPSAIRKKIVLFHGALSALYASVAVFILVNFPSMVLNAYAARGYTVVERALTEARILVLYIAQLLRPIQSKMGFFHDDVSVSTSLFDPVTTLLSIVFLAALFISAILTRRRIPLYAFGILFFFAAHLFESSIFALELMYEHRNYIASYGILIAVIAIVQFAMKNSRAKILLGAIGIFGLSLLTWQRATTWASPVTLYEFSYHAHPQSVRLNYFFSTMYADMGDFDKARQSVDNLSTGLGSAVMMLYLDCREHGQVDSDAVGAVARIPNGRADALVIAGFERLTEAILSGQCSVSSQSFLALTDFLLTAPVRKSVDQQTLLFGKARILLFEGRIDDALAAYQAAHALRPANAMPLYLSAHTLTMANRFDEAREVLGLARNVETDMDIHHRDLAKAVYTTVATHFAVNGELDTAIAVYSEANLAIPREPVFYLEKAGLLIQLHRYSAAEQALAVVRGLRRLDVAEHQHAIRRLHESLQEKRR